MGMDVIGIEPYTEDGKYFRSNVWCWRPLWDFVCNSCSLDDDIQQSGQLNDGYKIDEDLAVSIGITLKSLIDNGVVKQFAEFRQKELDAMPDVECKHCNGTGQRNDQYVQGTCNACHGKGTVRPTDTYYVLYEDMVEEFAEFAKQSGGFQIY